MSERADPAEAVAPLPAVASPDETPVPVLSEAERRFELRRRSVGLFAGPLALVAVLLWPLPDLSPEAHRLAAIVTMTVVWWVTEAIPIPVTGLVGVTLTVLFGVATPPAAYGPFGDPLIFLFIGSFVLSRAVVEHGLDRRLATTLLSVPAIGGSFARTRVAVGLIVVGLSAWMSNMVVTAMMVPVALGTLRQQASRLADRPGSLTTGLLLVVAFAASIGGMITPVGAAPNLITIGMLDNTAGVRISFPMWVAVAAPISLVTAMLLFVAGEWKFPFRGLPAAATVAATARRARDGWTAGQRNAAIAFTTAVVLWALPGILAVVAPGTAITTFLTERVGEPVAAMVAASLLFVLPVDWANRRFTMSWAQAARIDWGTILLMGSAFSLGRLMFETGLAERIALWFVETSGAGSLWTIAAVATLVGILTTELTSNVAAINMMLPVVIAVCQATGVNPVPPAIGTCLGTLLAFMLPISTPSNAIVFGTGLIPIREMIKFGIVMDAIGFCVIQVGLWILCPLLGLT